MVGPSLCFAVWWVEAGCVEAEAGAEAGAREEAPFAPRPGGAPQALEEKARPDNTANVTYRMIGFMCFLWGPNEPGQSLFRHSTFGEPPRHKLESSVCPEAMFPSRCPSSIGRSPACS